MNPFPAMAGASRFSRHRLFHYLPGTARRKPPASRAVNQ